MRSLWPRGGLWRHPDFLKLWAGQTVSQFGTQISLLALPFTAITILHVSAFQVALLGTVDFLPFILFTLPAGVWVDRLARRPILIVADVGRAAALASVPIAYALDGLTIWQLYGVGFVVGTLTVFFDVAYQSYLPSLVERDALVEGNSKLELSRSGAQLGGPGLAGWLISALAAPYAVLADAVSFLGSALFAARIRTSEHVPERSAAAGRRGPAMKAEIADGLRYLLRHPFLRPIAATTAMSNFFSSLEFAIFLVYAVRELGLGAAEVGLAFALSNVGYVAAALSANRVSRALGVGRTIIGSTFFFGPALLLIPLAPQSFPIPFFVVGLGLAIYGGVIYNITGISLTQAIVPERMLGRVNASRRFIVWGTIPLGSILGGVLASGIGLRPTIWIGAIAASLGFLPVLLSPLRSLRTTPEPEEPPPPGELALEMPLPAPFPQPEEP